MKLFRGDFIRRVRKPDERGNRVGVVAVEGQQPSSALNAKPIQLPRLLPSLDKRLHRFYSQEIHPPLSDRLTIFYSHC